MLSGLKCLRTYARTCLPPFPQQAFSIFTYDMQQVIRKRCKKPASRAEFLKHAGCWHPKEKLAGTQMCIDKWIIQLEQIKNLKPDDQIPAICCTYHQRSDCILSELSKMCDADNVKYVLDAIEGVSRDVIEFTCGPYKNTLACDKKFDDLVWGPLKQLVNTTDLALLASRHKYKSGVPPTVAVITHFDF